MAGWARPERPWRESCQFWAPPSLAPERKQRKHSADSAAEMERLADGLPIEQVAKRRIVAFSPGEALSRRLVLEIVRPAAREATQCHRVG